MEGDSNLGAVFRLDKNGTEPVLFDNSVRKFESGPGGIPQQLAFGDVGKVAARATELHHPPPFTGQGCPLRGRMGILFDAGNAASRVIKLDRAQPPRARLSYGTALALEFSGFSVFDE